MICISNKTAKKNAMVLLHSFMFAWSDIFGPDLGPNSVEVCVHCDEHIWPGLLKHRLQMNHTVLPYFLEIAFNVIQQLSLCNDFS